MQIIKNIDSLFRTLKNSGQDFEEVETKKRRYLVWNKIKYYPDDNAEKLTMSDLGMMQSAKREIIRNLENIKLPPNINKDFFIGLKNPYQYSYTYTADHIFFNHGPTFEQERKETIYKGDCIQIDINSAYLTAVKNRDLLSEKTYKKFYLEESDAKKIEKKKNDKSFMGHNGEIYKYSKKCRLITVGALAQDKKIFYYKGGILTHSERQYNEQQSNVFFTAAADIGKIMCKILNSCNGFFYWVDAVFIRPDFLEKAKKILEENNYQYHIKKMNIEQKGGNFKTTDEKGEIKNYSVPKSRTVENLELFNSELFANEILSEYKEICSRHDKETLRQKTSFVLSKFYNIECETSIFFLKDRAKKIGLNLSDILKIETTIIEEEKDAIFNNEILRTVIIKKIEDIENKKPLPAPVEILENGNIIEREFLFRTV